MTLNKRKEFAKEYYYIPLIAYLRENYFCYIVEAIYFNAEGSGNL